MRCHIRIALGTSGYAETYCYEPLDSQGMCAKHGQQAVVRPDWMSDEHWQATLSHVWRQTVVIRRNTGANTRGRRTSSGNS